MQSRQDLARQLPLDRLQPSTRQRFAEALAGDLDGQSWQKAAREVIVELLDKGDLVEVSLDGQTGARPVWYLVRGTSQLVDLRGLLPVKPAPIDPDSTEETAVQDLRSPDHLIGVLDAMEHAQDLQVGDPRSNEAGVLVERILSLLRVTMPQIHLHAQLHGLESVEHDSRFLIPTPSNGLKHFWQQQRRCGQAVWLHDARDLPEAICQKTTASLAAATATAVVPLLSPLDEQAEIGLLYVSARPGWTRERLLELASRLAAFVSRRWRCQHDVNRQVLADSLTGIHNRAFFASQFPLELERAGRAGLPLTLVLGDLDHFKSVNDRYGHPCGDLVLCTVARRLQAMLRRIDHVCRIGGEEFACLLPSTSCDEAREVLSRLISLPFQVDLPPEMGAVGLPVTMSYGAVTYPDAGTSHGELYRKADSMLYQAKRLGRNRCCLWMSAGRHQLLVPTTPPAASG